MFVSSFFLQVDICLITHYQLVASVAYVGSTCVHLVAIAHIDPVKATTNVCCYRVGWAIRHPPYNIFFSFVYCKRAVISAR